MYRNRRINAVLSALTKATVDDMRALQNDKYSLLAAELLPTLLKYIQVLKPDNAGMKELQELLSSWNYTFDADSRGAYAFNIFYKQLYRLTFDELLPARAYPKVKSYVFAHLLRTDTANGVFNIRSTPKAETAVDVIAMALEETARIVYDRSASGREVTTWGAGREVRLRHATRGISPFDEVLHIGGEEHCVNAMQSDHGPAWRIVVSLEDKVKAWAVYPGGQSGNPGSRHYDDFAAKWAAGELMELIFVSGGEVPRHVITQRFKPAS
jgi:penicillin amidase